MNVSCSKWVLDVLAQQACQRVIKYYHSGTLRVDVDGGLTHREDCHNTLGDQMAMQQSQRLCVRIVGKPVWPVV